jgi:hypothetical protein
MRGTKAKQLRREAKQLSNKVEIDYHDTVYTKTFLHPLLGKLQAYEVYTRKMVGNSVRLIYKQLKKLEG